MISCGNSNNEIFFPIQWTLCFDNEYLFEVCYDIDLDRESKCIYVVGNKINSTTNHVNGYITKFTKMKDIIWGKKIQSFEDDVYILKCMVDDEGYLYILGNTKTYISEEYNKNTFSGKVDVFLLKTGSDSSNIWLLYIGGREEEYGIDMSFDQKQNIYIVGKTKSSKFENVTMQNIPEYQPHGTDWNSFIAMVDKNGNCMSACVYGIERKNNVIGIDIANDGILNLCGEIFINGENKENRDIYLFQSDPSFENISLATYGGTGSDIPSSIKSDSSGNLYIIGTTNSHNLTNKQNAESPYNEENIKEETDAFIIKLNQKGELMWENIFGGNKVHIRKNPFTTKKPWEHSYSYGYDEANDIIIDKDNIYVIGDTHSYDFPKKNKGNNRHSRECDIFLAKFDSSGNLKRSELFGGKNNDYGLALTQDNEKNIYISGSTNSPKYYDKKEKDIMRSIIVIKIKDNESHASNDLFNEY